MNERFYLLKIRLLEIEPEIWRRFVVPASISLDRLHDVIQIVMGWTDSHLHEFTFGKKRYTEYPEYKDDQQASQRIYSRRPGASCRCMVSRNGKISEAAPVTSVDVEIAEVENLRFQNSAPQIPKPFGIGTEKEEK